MSHLELDSIPKLTELLMSASFLILHKDWCQRGELCVELMVFKWLVLEVAKLYKVKHSLQY
jgi:hypothetical protein